MVWKEDHLLKFGITTIPSVVGGGVDVVVEQGMHNYNACLLKFCTQAWPFYALYTFIGALAILELCLSKGISNSESVSQFVGWSVHLSVSQSVSG